jgi:hypothetical protein
MRRGLFAFIEDLPYPRLLSKAVLEGRRFVNASLAGHFLVTTRSNVLGWCFARGLRMRFSFVEIKEPCFHIR